MKKYISLFTLALLALAFSFSACSDDDDAKKDTVPSTPEEIAASKTSEAAMQLMGLLSAVADVDSLPDNWFEAAFTVEPTVGTVLDDAQPYVRSIAVENAKEAAAVYANLTDKTFDASLTADSWSYDGIGSLTYKLENKSDVIATIDCQLKQVPHLTQLRLVKSDALGENASSSFTGEAHYNFGDVVFDTEEKSYWICVRPALQNVKGDSHWFSFDLQDSNYKTYEANSKKNLKRTVVPTNLDKDVEMMGYLMNLLSVIANPNACADYFQKGHALEDGLGNLGTEACSVSDVQRIARNWQGKGIWNHLPVGPEYFKQGTITVFYYGYSSKLFGGGMSIYGRNYTGDAYSQSSKADLEWDSYQNMAFDTHCYAQTGYNSPNNEVGPDAALIVRYRSSKDFDKKADPLKPFDPGRYKDTYRFRDPSNVDNPLGRRTKAGDLFRDKTTGASWFTLFPSGTSKYDTGDAMLISFDSRAFNVTDGGNQITNAPTRHEASRIAFAFSDFVGKDNRNNREIREYLKKNLNIDLKKMIVERDSTYMILDTIPSESKNDCSSIIYNDSATGKTRLLRFVLDNTRAGSRRADDPDGNMYMRYYTRYLASDKAAINWADVMEAYKVRQYAIDEWTRAKLHGDATAIPYRRTAETGQVKLSDYFYSREAGNFVNPALKNMFNEPVIVCVCRYLDEKAPWPADLEVQQASTLSVDNFIVLALIQIFDLMCETSGLFKMDGENYSK